MPKSTPPSTHGPLCSPPKDCYCGAIHSAARPEEPRGDTGVPPTEKDYARLRELDASSPPPPSTPPEPIAPNPKALDEAVGRMLRSEMTLGDAATILNALDAFRAPATPSSPEARNLEIDDAIDRVIEASADLEICEGNDDAKDRAHWDARLVAARSALLALYLRQREEIAEGIVQLGGIALMIGGHFREGVWFLEHPKAPAPIPCESIAHLVEKYLKIIEHFAVESTVEITALSSQLERLSAEQNYAGQCVNCRALGVLFGKCGACGFEQSKAADLVERLKADVLTPAEARLLLHVLDTRVR